MEEANHWTTIVKCNLCDEIPSTVPLYQCPLHHQYCTDCFIDLRKRYRGYLPNGATCVVCKTTAVFTQSKVNTDFLNKIRAKPGIGRPYRYNANQIVVKGFNYSRLENKELPKPPNGVNVTVEGLFRLPSEELRLLLSKKKGFTNSVNLREPRVMEEGKIITPRYVRQTNVNQSSKVPIKCPHKPCKKVVATSMFLTHFKYEHSNIPKYSIERAMITVYEFNKIDVRRSQSSQSVIKTCGKFSQHVPINSFWLMVTGSPERRQNYSAALFWLFCPCEEQYLSTIEVCSKSNSIAFSTFCEVHITAQNLKFRDIAGNLHGLIVSRASLGTLLEEGPELNLRITVH